MNSNEKDGREVNKERIEDQISQDQVLKGSLSDSSEDPNQRPEQLMELIEELEVQEQELDLAKKVGRENENKYRSIFNNSPVAYITLSKTGIITEVNDQAGFILNRSHRQLEKKPFVTLVEKDYHEKFFAFLHEVMYEKQLEIIDMELKIANDVKMYVRIHGISLESEDEKKKECILSIISIDDIKRHETEINYLVYHDSLTGLANRRRLEERLEEIIIESKRNSDKFAILYMDLDEFKQINDAMGHTFGDQLLKETGNRIQRNVRKTELVARMGGDEFCVLMPRLMDEKDASNLAIRLMNAIKLPYKIMENQCYITTSIGIAIYPVDGNNSHDLLINADTAMYESKRQHKGSYSFSNEKIRKRLEMNFRNITALRQAVVNNELYYAIQPIVNTQGKSQISEVLMRWHSKKLGEISPSYFIDLAEKNHLISYIGDWLIYDLAMNEELTELVREKDIKLTLNISTLQLLEENFADHLMKLIHSSKLTPSQFIIEITENVLIENLEKAHQVLRDLKNKDILIALDDFGKGYSSLTYLNELNIDYIKIDRAFISQCDEDKKKQQLIILILGASKFLNIKVIAEGVENEREFAFLKQQGCELFQGYYFSKPLPLNEFEIYVQV